MNFKYQIVFCLKDNDSKKVVFVGTTNLPVIDLIGECLDVLCFSIDFVTESVMYEPFKMNENEQEKEP